MLLAVKIGAGAIQEVKISQAEALVVRTALQALIYAKEKLPAGA